MAHYCGCLSISLLVTMSYRVSYMNLCKAQDITKITVPNWSHGPEKADHERCSTTRETNPFKK